MKNNISKTVIGFVCLLLFNACGTEDTATKTINNDEPGVLQTGVFVDSPVEGLFYRCSISNNTGLTNVDGEYTCGANEEVYYYIGDLFLGKTSMNALTSPYDITDTQTATINIARLLQSIDADGDLSNGIKLENTNAYYISLQNITVDFNAANFEDTVGSLLHGNLVDALSAKEHMDNTLQVINTKESNETIIDPEIGIKKESCGMIEPDESFQIDSYLNDNSVYVTLEEINITKAFSGKSVLTVGSEREINNCYGYGIDIISTVQYSAGYDYITDENDLVIYDFGIALDENATMNNKAYAIYIDKDNNESTGKFFKDVYINTYVSRSMGSDRRIIINHPKNTNGYSSFSEWNIELSKWEKVELDNILIVEESISPNNSSNHLFRVALDNNKTQLDIDTMYTIGFTTVVTLDENGDINSTLDRSDLQWR